MEFLQLIFINMLMYCIDKISYADIISSLALLTAIGALAWNIVRDLILERIAVEFSIAFGEIGNIKDSKTGLFADAGSLPNHKFDNPGMLVQIVNTGRRLVGIAGVGGEFKNGQWLSMTVDGLPKMLQPYEIFSSTANAKSSFLQQVHNGEIKKLWVTDTKGEKWLLSEKGWKRLEDTANYIISNKHK